MEIIKFDRLHQAREFTSLPVIVVSKVPFACKWEHRYIQDNSLRVGPHHSRSTELCHIVILYAKSFNLELRKTKRGYAWLNDKNLDAYNGGIATICLVDHIGHVYCK